MQTSRVRKTVRWLAVPSIAALVLAAGIAVPSPAHAEDIGKYGYAHIDRWYGLAQIGHRKPPGRRLTEWLGAQDRRRDRLDVVTRLWRHGKIWYHVRARGAGAVRFLDVQLRENTRWRLQMCRVRPSSGKPVACTKKKLIIA